MSLSPDSNHAQGPLRPLSRAVRWRTGVLLICLGLTTAGTLSATNATPPSEFKPGDPVSSAKLNAMFKDLYASAAATEANLATALKLAQGLDAKVKALTDNQVPPGTVAAYAGATTPAGWIKCDGSAHNANAEPELKALYAAIGKQYGPGNATDGAFNLPDLRGRTVFGADGMGGTGAGRLTAAAPGGINGAALGAAGGEQVHTLGLDEIAKHGHGGTFASADHAHTAGPLYAQILIAANGNILWNKVGVPQFSTNVYSTGPSATKGLNDTHTYATGIEGTTNGPTKTAGIAENGGGKGHNTVPPGIVLNYMVKL